MRLLTCNRMLASLALCAAFLPAVHAAETPVTAVWQPHNIEFRYSGFTTRYSCQGIRDKVKLLLRTLGARDDVRVQNTCAGSHDDVQPFHRLRLAFSLPAPAGDTNASETTFDARWEGVRIGQRHPRGFDGGDCELVEQFSDQVLVKLNTRQYRNDSRCVPHQRSPGAINTTAVVLLKLPEPEQATLPQ